MSSAALRLTFYGDDFTGSTDVMEGLYRHGLRSMLFLEPPRPEDLARHPGIEAVGVAGVSRSLTPAQADEVLPSAFTALAALGAPLFHYKVCSTFDSAPEIGSIGHAIDIGQRVFASPFVPLVVGAPILRRYCLFGNLFATVGDETYRIDRHPTMSRHPLTPMHEGDLRVHLGAQTKKRIGLMDILHLTGSASEVDARLQALLASNTEVVLFDVLDDDRLATIGRLITEGTTRRPTFVVGSSGVEYALASHWRRTGQISGVAPKNEIAPVDQIVVISGSCSPATGEQIAWAEEHGFASLALDPVRLIDPTRAAAEQASILETAMAALGQGKSVVLHTARGPQDARIGAAGGSASAGPRLADALGRLLRAILNDHPVRRFIIAGGDTSGHALRQLQAQALEPVATTAPGSPLCRLHAPRSSLDGCELVLKGGQVGKPDFFGAVRDARL